MHSNTIEIPTKEELIELRKTKSLIEIADIYFVSRQLVSKWVKGYGLSTERKNTFTKEIREEVDKAGIKFETYKARIRAGWTHEESLKPIITKADYWKNHRTVITDEHFKIAEKNGLKRKTVQDRVYTRKWSVEDAINIKTINPKDRYRGRIDTPTHK